MRMNKLELNRRNEKSLEESAESHLQVNKPIWELVEDFRKKKQFGRRDG